MTNPLYDALFVPHEGKDTSILQLANGSTVSYRTFFQNVDRTANTLVSLGIVPGGRVAGHIAKSPIALSLYAACVKAGAVSLPLNTAYTPRELDYFIGDSGAALFVCDPSEKVELGDRHRRVSGSNTWNPGRRWCRQPDGHRGDAGLGIHSRSAHRR